MTHYTHGGTTFSHEAPISADEWMNAVQDWAEQVEFMLDKLPLKCTRSVYAPGSVKGQYPLSRHVTVDKAVLSPEEAGAIPDIFVETCVWLDPVARMLLYRIEGEPWGMRNYFCFNEVDPIGADSCRVTVTSRFDVPDPVTPDALIPGFHEAYREMIVGIADYAISKR